MEAVVATKRTPLDIFHVEDMNELRSAIERATKMKKKTYVGFSSGEEALKCYASYDPKVVILDNDLSNGGGKWDGYVTARRIRDINPDQLIYSASSGFMRDEVYLDRPLFDAHLGKDGLRQFIFSGTIANETVG